MAACAGGWRATGRLWAASYYAKARAEIAEDERRARAKERRAQAGSQTRAICDAHLPPARCLAADEGTSTVVTTAYVVPTCESLAEREHPGPYQEDWRRGCEESADSRSRGLRFPRATATTPRGGYSGRVGEGEDYVPTVIA